MTPWNRHRGPGTCALLALLILASGCGKGMREIREESADWRVFMEETRDQLMEEKREALATEINEFLREAEGDAGEELRANADFFRERLSMQLWGGGEASSLVKVTPRIINRLQALHEQPELTFYGWDLRLSAVQAFHHLYGTDPVEVPDAVAISGPYSGTIDLTKVNLTPDSEHLEIRIAEQGSYFINVIQPPLYEVHISGTIWGTDWTGIGSIGKTKEHEKSFSRSRTMNAIQLKKETRFDQWVMKYGGELRVEADLFVKQRDNGLEVSGEARFYEGVTEDSKDEVDGKDISFLAGLDGTTTHEVPLKNMDVGKRDEAKVNLEVLFSSVQRETTQRTSYVTLSGELGDRSGSEAR